MGANLHVSLNHVFLLYVTFTPLIMPLADWPLPSFMHAWACVYAWKSFDSLCQGQGFSSSLCQITGRLTDEHSYTANLRRLSSPVSAPHLSRFSATHRYTYLKICSWDSFEGVQRWDGLAELSVQHQHPYFIVIVNISAIYSLLTLISI